MSLKYLPLASHHCSAVIALGNAVHGDNYLDRDSLEHLMVSGIKNRINASYVAVIQDEQLSGLDSERDTPDGYLVGFRITKAPGQWQIDKWCSPAKWKVDAQKVCYFKCNTVDSDYRGRGIGSAMLQKSINAVKRQGGLAGLAHIWLASPGNSAFRYFSANGGYLIKEHPDKWLSKCIEEGYVCPICGPKCHCVAAEMLMQFD